MIVNRKGDCYGIILGERSTQFDWPITLFKLSTEYSMEFAIVRNPSIV